MMILIVLEDYMFLEKMDKFPNKMVLLLEIF